MESKISLKRYFWVNNYTFLLILLSVLLVYVLYDGYTMYEIRSTVENWAYSIPISILVFSICATIIKGKQSYRKYLNV